MVVLKNQISESLLLAIPAGGDAMIVSKIAGNRPFSPQISRGTRWTVPTSPTARVILAFSHENTRERILSRRTERDPELDVQFDPNDLRRTMGKIRAQFHEFDENPHQAGFSALVVPVFNYLDRIEAALTVVMPMRANDPNQETRYLRPVKETAIEISRVLGSVEMADKMAATL
jgi:DNA-binding IclR family transcriptional regulator